MKHDFKLEGDKAIISFGAEHGIDKDQDGAHSFKATVQGVIELDASELFEEFLKDADFVKKIKEKLGIN